MEFDLTTFNFWTSSIVQCFKLQKQKQFRREVLSPHQVRVSEEKSIYLGLIGSDIVNFRRGGRGIHPPVRSNNSETLIGCR
jgi:carbamate kinase